MGAQTPAEPRSTARDRDQEAAWCSDFGELQKVVAQAGGGIEIERALGVGTEAVKTVAFDGMAGETNADTFRPARTKALGACGDRSRCQHCWQHVVLVV